MPPIVALEARSDYGETNQVGKGRCCAATMTVLVGIPMTLLSCYRLRPNEVRLGNLWRRLVLPQRIEKWSLTSLQQRLVKTGGRLVKHARYYWLFLAEGHLNRRLFASMLRLIAALPLPDG